jgi:hypothetical protein
MGSTIKEQEWYDDPFGWYEKHDRPEMLGIKMNEYVALDFLQGLYDIYQGFKTKNKEKAMKDARVLATLLIASCTGYGDEAVQELLVDEFNSKDIDAELNKILEGDDDD